MAEDLFHLCALASAVIRTKLCWLHFWIHKDGVYHAWTIIQLRYCSNYCHFRVLPLEMLCISLRMVATNYHLGVTKATVSMVLWTKVRAQFTHGTLVKRVSATWHCTYSMMLQGFFVCLGFFFILNKPLPRVWQWCHIRTCIKKMTLYANTNKNRKVKRIDEPLTIYLLNQACCSWHVIHTVCRKFPQNPASIHFH